MRGVKGRKAQVAMEYVMVFGVAFFLTLPLIILFFAQTQNMESDIAGAQLLKASREIMDAVEEVYFMGEPAQKTIVVTFPDTISSVSVDQHSIHYVIEAGGQERDHYTDTLVNLTGSLKTHGGMHTVRIRAQGGTVDVTDDLT